jgi:hypothetical protein
VTEVRAQIRSLFQGLGSLVGSPAWARMGKRETALIVVKGSVEGGATMLIFPPCAQPAPVRRACRCCSPNITRRRDIAEIEAADSHSVDVDIVLEAGPAFVVKAI